MNPDKTTVLSHVNEVCYLIPLHYIRIAMDGNQAYNFNCDIPLVHMYMLI